MREYSLMKILLRWIVILSSGLVLSMASQAQSSPDSGTPLILTPPAPATPRINGPKIFGVRPGSPFQYSIPATGDRPMKFSDRRDLPLVPRNPLG